jgi:hypothetical protein
MQFVLSCLRIQLNRKPADAKRNFTSPGIARHRQAAGSTTVSGLCSASRRTCGRHKRFCSDLPGIAYRSFNLGTI